MGTTGNQTDIDHRLIHNGKRTETKWNETEKTKRIESNRMSFAGDSIVYFLLYY